MEHIHYEDENTRCAALRERSLPFTAPALTCALTHHCSYVDIGPVNKVVNMLCCWLEDPNVRPSRHSRHCMCMLTPALRRPWPRGIAGRGIQEAHSARARLLVGG